MLQVDSFGYEKHERFSMAETDVVTLAIKVKAEDAKKQLDAFHKRLSGLTALKPKITIGEDASSLTHSKKDLNGFRVQLFR